MSIPIIPFIETRPSTTFSLAEVSVQSINLGVSANVRVLFYTQDKSEIRVKDLVLEQPEYGQWGTNDKFIIDWALAQIGVKHAPCPPCEICESMCGGHESSH